MNTLTKIGMIEISKGVYAKVVKKGSCTAEFNRITKEIKGGFRYLPISTDDPVKMNGYDKMIGKANIDIDYETENLIIINTNQDEPNN